MTVNSASTSPTGPPAAESREDSPGPGEHAPATPRSLHDQQRELVRASLIARPR